VSVCTSELIDKLDMWDGGPRCVDQIRDVCIAGDIRSIAGVGGSVRRRESFFPPSASLAQQRGAAAAGSPHVFLASRAEPDLC
jgi:hypothetical protein